MPEPHNDTGDQFPNVLLVEDNPLHVRLVQTMLREVWGDISTLRVAERLDMAIGHLRQSLPDVILLDLVLPDADQLDGLHEVLSFAPNTPVVVLSAHEDEEHALQALAAGAQDYLVKGRVGSDRLAKAMRYAMVRGGVAVPRRAAPSRPERTGRAIIGLDGNVLGVDRGLTEITGLNAGQLVGNHVMGVTTPDDAASWSELLRDVDVSTPSRTVTLGVRTTSGGVRSVAAELVPMLSTHGATEMLVRFTTMSAAATPSTSHEAAASQVVSA
jgi:CheY-like chemotaxis protein